MSNKKRLIDDVLSGNLKTIEDIRSYLENHLATKEQTGDDYYIDKIYDYEKEYEGINQENMVITTKMISCKLLNDYHLYTITAPVSDYYSDEYNNGIVITGTTPNYTVARVRDQYPKPITLDPPIEDEID